MRRALLMEKRKNREIETFFKKFETISLVDFEKCGSVWCQAFYQKFQKWNSIYSIPNFVIPCGLLEDEIRKRVLEYLGEFKHETKFLFPFDGSLVNIEVSNFSDTIQELWIHGVDIIMASKHKEKMFHIFEAEYEYHCYLERLFN